MATPCNNAYDCDSIVQSGRSIELPSLAPASSVWNKKSKHPRAARPQIIPANQGTCHIAWPRRAPTFASNNNS
ncbi:MAG: hypothetical protein OXC07_02030 [Kistimonas sp.]|nr:hypothetical protein [Kistimonas sp.]